MTRCYGRRALGSDSRCGWPSGLCLAASAVLGCFAPVEPPSPGPTGVGAGEPIFVERAKETGLDFVHRGGRTGELYFLEIMGAGGALVDVDNDGDLDVFLPQGHRLAPGADGSSREKTKDRLFLNDLSVAPDGTRRLAFSDATEASGILGVGYGLGVAVGDYNNDGWVDLYVTNHGPNQLWRNRGGAGGPSFEDVTLAAGADDPGWSTSATFLDCDRDGWLDLYIVSYVDYSIENDIPCRSSTGLGDYCGPLTYAPRRDRLLHNRGASAAGGGEGARRLVTFEDVSRRLGLWSETERGLGVVSGDFNRDGWPDLYVANDMTPNVLWVNRGIGPDDRQRPFQNEALLAGCAVNRGAKPEASMGVVAGDVDGDGDEDLFMTHLASETNTLYRNDGHGLFDDTTALSRLGNASLEATGFGAAFIDFDNDGDLDLLTVNGAVSFSESQGRSGQMSVLSQPNQLFLNLGRDGDGHVGFAEVTGQASAALAVSEVSRGTALGDVDNDGDLDVLVTNNHGPVRLLLNAVGNRHHWLGVRLVDGEVGRDMLGAVVRAVLADGRVLTRRVRTDGSYCSANDPRLLFGLGQATRVDRLEVDWPGGSSEVFGVQEVDRYMTLVRGGAGPPAEAKPRS